MRRISIAFVAATALLASASVASAQGFNCRYAKTPDEVAVCNSPDLSDLDRTLNQLYSEARLALPRYERPALEAQQARWLAARRQCGAAEGCLRRVYMRRIGQLEESDYLE